MCVSRMRRLALWLVLVWCGAAAHAEPYLAVQSGQKCAQCHTNGTGGGMRTPFGNLFAQNQLAANKLDTGADWTGSVGTYLGLGADMRSALTVTDVPGTPRSNAFDLREARVYLNVTPIPGRLSLYVDQLVAPDSALNREAFVRYTSGDGALYVKAGRMYLPFGWRLQDNEAFVRSETTVNMSSPDTGVELGWDRDALSLQFAVSNGTQGAPENDRRKQFSLQGSWIRDTWRVGLAGNLNDAAAGDRTALGVFGGLRTGPVSWLAEFDTIEDRSTVATIGRGTKSSVWLLEGNWRIVQGHNLKLTTEYLDPDRDIASNRQRRNSVVYEYTPLQYLQLRAGLRHHDGPSQFPVQNRRLLFVEAHGFF
jgi:hypothetical protein